MDRNLALEFVRVTEAAAVASARLMGRGDERAADEAAVQSADARVLGVRLWNRRGSLSSSLANNIHCHYIYSVTYLSGPYPYQALCVFNIIEANYQQPLMSHLGKHNDTHHR